MKVVKFTSQPPYFRFFSLYRRLAGWTPEPPGRLLGRPSRNMIPIVTVLRQLRIRLFYLQLIYPKQPVSCTIWSCCIQCSLYPVLFAVAVSNAACILYHLQLLYSMQSVSCTICSCCIQCSLYPVPFAVAVFNAAGILYHLQLLYPMQPVSCTICSCCIQSSLYPVPFAVAVSNAACILYHLQLLYPMQSASCTICSCCIQCSLYSVPFAVAVSCTIPALVSCHSHQFDAECQQRVSDLQANK